MRSGDTETQGPRDHRVGVIQAQTKEWQELLEAEEAGDLIPKNLLRELVLLASWFNF